MSAPARLRVALVGAGRASAQLHAPLLQQMPDRFEIVAVVDADPVRAASLARTSGTPSYTALSDPGLVQQPLDAVVCAVPWDQHADVVEACLARHLPVLCEKPATLLPSHLARMLDAESASSARVTVACQKRHDAALQQLLASVRRAHVASVVVRVLDPNAPQMRRHLGPLPAGQVAADEQADLDSTLGRGVPPWLRFAYLHTLGGSLVHWVNWTNAMLRPRGLSLRGTLSGCLLRDGGRRVLASWDPAAATTVVMSYERVPAHIPYCELLEVVTDEGLHRVVLPAPYLRDVPSTYRHTLLTADGLRDTVFESAPSQRSYVTQLERWHAGIVGDLRSDAPRCGLDEAAEDLDVLVECATAALAESSSRPGAQAVPTVDVRLDASLADAVPAAAAPGPVAG